MRRNDLVTGCLLAFGSEFLYGLSYVFTKQATGSAGGLALLGWRFVLAFIAMSVLAALGVIKIRLRGRRLMPLLRVAIFSPVIFYLGETFGISLTTASESGAFMACIPVGCLIASTLILHKKPTGLQTAGILITLAGVLVTVFAVGASSSLSVPGYLLLVAAVVSLAFYFVSVDKASDYSGAEVTYIMLALGAAVFSVLAVLDAARTGSVTDLLALPARNKGFLAAILYQGIGCSILAFIFSNAAIMKIGVNRVSSFIGVSTVVSILAGTLLLHEKFTLFQVIGAAVIIAGIYIANAGKTPEEKAAEGPPAKEDAA